MSAERLLALKASAARTRLRVQVMNGRPVADTGPLRELRTFPELSASRTAGPSPGIQGQGSRMHSPGSPGQSPRR
jgi:hypothetical protein